jgi:hypothetical protein
MQTYRRAFDGEYTLCAAIYPIPTGTTASSTLVANGQTSSWWTTRFRLKWVKVTTSGDARDPADKVLLLPPENLPAMFTGTLGAFMKHLIARRSY